MPIKSNREYRALQMDVVTRDEEQGEEMRVAGYATVFDTPYTLWRDKDLIIEEQVATGAFEETDMSDVIMQYDHQGRVFARISNETLEVRQDEKGLYIEADLSGTEIGRELYEEIRGGYTNKMSFGFTVDSDTWEESEGEDGVTRSLRTINKVGKLYDVSAVSIPANDATVISARALVDGEIDRLRAERLERARLETKRRITQLKIK